VDGFARSRSRRVSRSIRWSSATRSGTTVITLTSGGGVGGAAAARVDSHAASARRRAAANRPPANCRNLRVITNAPFRRLLMVGHGESERQGQCREKRALIHDRKYARYTGGDSLAKWTAASKARFAAHSGSACESARCHAQCVCARSSVVPLADPRGESPRRTGHQIATAAEQSCSLNSRLHDH